MAFFDGWTRKDACLKAIRGGLTDALNNFDVTPSSKMPPRILRPSGDPVAAECWSLDQLDPGSSYRGAMAARGTGHRYRYFERPWFASSSMLSNPAEARHKAAYR